MRESEGRIDSMKLTPEKISAFLHVLSETCNVGKSCAAVGISRQTAYGWRDDDPEFAAAWDRAKAVGVTALEDEAHRRAFEGTDKPIVHQGVITDTMKEYSDTLAIFLLKAHAPDRYRERSSIDMTAAVASVNVEDQERADKLASLITKVAARASGTDDSELV